MPAFVAAMIGGLLSVVGSWAGQMLISLGIGVVTYKGTDIVLDKLKAQAIANFTSLPPDIFALLAYMKVGVAISIITSAIAIRAGLSGANGVVKKFVKK